MHYLIDGHNLIAKTPGIDLSDPDDEAQLVLRLRRWTAASRKRRVTVYFDGGLPGGPAHDLSGARLKVIFASTGRSADDLILNRIRKVKNPPEFTVVSSDREILDAAEKRKMPTIPSESFAGNLEEVAAERARPEEPTSPSDEPLLSEDEVAQWMELFGPEPEIPPRPPRKPAPSSSRQESEKKPRRPPAMRDPRELKDSGESLTEEEVARWMELFGPEPEEPDQADPSATSEAAKELRRRRRERRRKKGAPPRPADEMKESGADLTEDEVEEWLDVFTNPDDE